MRKILILIACTFVILTAHARNGVTMTLETGFADHSGLPATQIVGAINKNSLASFPSAYYFDIGYNHDFCTWFGLGFTVGLGQFGDTIYYFPNNANSSYKSYTNEFLGQLLFHLTHSIDTLITLGGIRQTAKIHYFNSPFPGRMRIQPEAGVGIIYNFNRHFGVIGNYRHTIGNSLQYIDGREFKEPSLNELLFGVRITFG